MLLTEAEGKELLKRAGLRIPKGVIVSSQEDLSKVADKNLAFPLYAKAQVLHGNRELQEMITEVREADELPKVVWRLLSSTDQYDQPITSVLVEEAVAYERELYLSLSYDTHLRQLVAQFSREGGTGMDNRGQTLDKVPLSIIDEPKIFPPEHTLLPVLQKLWNVVKEHDAALVEVNPIVSSGDAYYCLDAKIQLEDTALFRHEEWERYPERSPMGRPPTEREKKAQKVSRMDHRGVAGESFFEFISGDVGVMASGGGASLLAMDALMSAGVSPANYTEYSGNPTKEKVQTLTNVVLSIPNLQGLYVVGSNANFTDIYETLAGVVDGFLDSAYAQRDDFAILIRRGGPRWQEAFRMVEEKLAQSPAQLQLFGPDFPIVETAAEMKKMLED